MVLGVLALATLSGGGSVDAAQAAAKRSAPPCQAAFPDARQKTIGKTTWFNRQESVRQVVCYHFGLEPSADFPVSWSMACGLVGKVIGKRAPKLALFSDGACSGVEVAGAPKEPTKYIGIACSWAATLLGSGLGSAGCTLAPPVGTALGSMFESKHELDVAIDVIQHGKCVKYSPTHFGSAWLAEDCAPGDKGFTTLPLHKATAPPPPQAAGGGSGGSGSGGGPSGPPTAGAPMLFGDLIAVPSTVVAGQSFDLENGQCPLGTNAVFDEILPLGETADPATPRSDGEHLGGIITGSIGSLVVTGTSPYMEPGNYEFVLDCFDRAPSAPGANLLRTARTPLTISEPGRTVEISPAAATPGATIEITPLGPCAGTEGGTVTVMFFSPQTQVAAGHANGSCKWGPSQIKVPSVLSPGEYSVEVVVTVNANSPEVRYFIYQSTMITIE